MRFFILQKWFSSRKYQIGTSKAGLTEGARSLGPEACELDEAWSPTVDVEVIILFFGHEVIFWDKNG